MNSATVISPEQIIRDTLREQGRSARWLAGQMHWSANSLRHALAGQRPMGRERLQAAARVLGIPGYILTN